MLRGLILCLTIVGVFGSNIGGTRQSIEHDADGGYTNLLVAIDENVAEDLNLIEEIKNVFTAGSTFMFDSTNEQKYFKQVTIHVPVTWTHQSSWEAVTDETFQRARVLIAPSAGSWGDRPYTKQPGGCGDEGDYIHFTPEYITRPAKFDSELFAPAEKTLIHEFAHLRWGLFDEYAIDENDQAWYTYRRKVYPNRCTRWIVGTMTDPSTRSGACNFERRTGFPTASCQFIPDPQTTAKASLMFAEHLSSVVKFCSNGRADKGETLHGYLAVNRQNRLCGKSSWGVMNTHSDFAATTTPPSDKTPSFKIVHDYDVRKLEAATTTTTTETTTTTTTSTTATTTPTTTTKTPTTTTTTPTTTTTTPTTTTTTPTTTTTTPKTAITTPTATTTETTATTTETTTNAPEEPEVGNPDRVCLVLDVSGSMGVEDRINKMGTAMVNYIRNYLEAGSVVGIVKFSTDASVLSTMTMITDNDVRDILVDLIPTSVGGGTSIGDGLKACSDVLAEYDPAILDSSRILLVSDGQETQSLYVADVLQSVIDRGITVDTIAYSQAADTVMSEVSIATGGYAYYFSGGESSSAMQDALLATVERRRTTRSPVTLESLVNVVTAGSSLVKSIPLDISIGRDTRLVFSHGSDITVEVTTNPEANITVITDVGFKLTSIYINEVFNGDLTYNLTNSGSSDKPIVTSVTSRSATPGASPITAVGRMNVQSIDFTGDSKVNVFADVYFGITPVLNVNVIATMELPDGTTFTLELQDNGAGADTIKDDGVYAGFFLSSQFSGNGYYSMKIDVNGSGVISGGTAGSGTKISCLGQCSSKKSISGETGSISRSASGGLLLVENFNAAIAAADNFAPSRIRDLKLLQAVYGSDRAVIGWTAPGDDLDQGQVSGYEYTVSYDTHTNPNVTAVPLLPLLIHDNSSFTDALAGQTAHLTIITSLLDTDVFGNVSSEVELDTFFFRVRAYDEAGNYGDWSNEVSISYVNPDDYASPVLLTTTPAAPVSNTGLIVGIAVGCTLAVAVLVALAVGIMYYLKKKNANKTADSESDGVDLKKPMRSVTPSAPMNETT